jgi:8-oxo-dGTP pyrophosphatase MutT (NUDIX family)
MKTINRYLQESNKSFEKKNSVKGLVKLDKLILILRRAEGDKGHGQWDLPGGCIEKDENKEDALKREVFEESNLKITDIKFVTTTNLKIPEQGVDSDMHVYTCKTNDSDVILKPRNWDKSGLAEHNEYRWVQFKDDVENLPMLPQLKKILLKYLKTGTHEYLNTI